MIRGIGVDIIEIARIEKSLSKSERLVDRILTIKEQEVFQSYSNQRRKIEFLAGRFAAKEAFAKAHGTGIGQLSFQHIEVLADELGAPRLTAQGYDAEKLFVSISHSELFAVAQVIITR